MFNTSLVQPELCADFRRLVIYCAMMVIQSAGFGVVLFKGELALASGIFGCDVLLIGLVSFVWE